jgi:membrane protein YdbS with pleckstrin-like domain
MAKKVKRKNIRKSKKEKVRVSPFGIYWERGNYLFLIMGFAVIIIGFYIMSIGQWDSVTSLVVSPILLVIGYVLIFPASIFYRKRKLTENSRDDKVGSSES